MLNANIYRKNFLHQDRRLVNVARIKSLIPALAFAYMLPITLPFLPFGRPKMVILVTLLINHSFTLPISSFIISRFIKDTTPTARIHNPKADLPFLRVIYGITGTISAFPHVVRLYLSIYHIILKIGFHVPEASISSGGMAEGSNNLLKHEYTYTFIASLYWLLLHFQDLKRHGKVKMGWLGIFTFLGGVTFLAGPGTAMALGWWVREEALAYRVARTEGIARR